MTELGDAAAIFAAYGVTGRDLLDICMAIARSYEKKTQSTLDSRIDDLAQHLALTACRRVGRYDPARATIRTWLWVNLQPACVDWHRRKAEGFADSRRPYEAPVLVAQFDDDEADQLVDEFVGSMRPSGEKVRRWAAAAETLGLTPGVFVGQALDAASDAVERMAAMDDRTRWRKALEAEAEEQRTLKARQREHAARRAGIPIEEMHHAEERFAELTEGEAA
jgi:hypothetical protein